MRLFEDQYNIISKIVLGKKGKVQNNTYSIVWWNKSSYLFPSLNPHPLQRDFAAPHIPWIWVALELALINKI